MFRKRAEKAIGQGALTNSKHWDTHVKGVYPTHIRASSGCYIYDENNKKYVDNICGLGTNLLGYGHPLVENEVESVRFQGKSPSLPHMCEVELAEDLKQMFPWVQKWKFLKTGSEACSAAIRIARAYTGKKLVYSEGYHGWHDTFTSLTPPAYGCPENDKLDIHKFYPGYEAGSFATAAYIVEPVMVDDSEERIQWLKSLKEQARKREALLIFDEVITGFRYKQNSVSKAYDLRPDLIVIGKAMANGYPLAAVGGSADVMDSNYFVSSTYAGDISSITAARAVSRIVRANPNYHIDLLLEQGQKFLEEFNSYSRSLNFEIKGYPTRGVFEGNDLNIALFMQESCKAGLLFGKSWFISHSHIPHIKQITDSCKDILKKMSKKLPSLQGELPKSPFSTRSRNG